MTKYKDIMNRIELTDEMRERVLKNVKEQAAAGETDSSLGSGIHPVRPAAKKDRVMLIRSLSIAASFLLIASGVFIAWKVAEKKNRQKVTEPSGSQIVQGTDASANGTIDPYGKECGSIDEVNREAGMNLHDLKTLPFVPDTCTYSVYAGKNVLITYASGSDDECMITITSDAADMEALAENYSNYSNPKAILLDDGTCVKLYGEEEGSSYAVWQSGTRYCSIQFFGTAEDTVFEKMAAEINGML